MKPTSFDQMLASALLEMTSEPTLPATLDRIAALVVEMVESCDAAAVVLLEDHASATVVASDETLRDLALRRYSELEIDLEGELTRFAVSATVEMIPAGLTLRTRERHAI